MNAFLIKLRHILPRFLAITIGTVLIVAIARWLDIRFHILGIYEENWSLVIPFALPWIPLTIWFRKCNRILVFGKGGDNERPRLVPQLIAGFMMAGMLMYSEDYIVASSSRVAPLDSALVKGIKPDARYYPHDFFFADINFAGTSTNLEYSGKNDQYIDYTIFYVAPINNYDTGGIPECWYGLKFEKRLSSNLPLEVSEKILDSFYDNCIENLSYYNFDSLTYFERVPDSDDKAGYLAAIEARIERQAGSEHIILEPRHEPLKDRTGNSLMWISVIFGSGTLLLIIFLFFAGLSRNEHELQLQGTTGETDDILQALQYLIPRGEHFITSIIIDLNILVYLAMVFSGLGIMSFDAGDLIRWGALERSSITGGEWWRLLSCTFLHGGLVHLVLNIFGLVIAAMFVEPILGRARYGILYLLSGICGSLLSSCWHDDNMVSVGASGAIFGLYGAVLGLLLTKAFPREERQGVFVFISIYVGINLIWGLAGGIDNAAHIGGLVSGAIFGILLFKTGMNPRFS
jgi:rhomboid protease GluP